eukprot:179168_1
MTYQQAASKSKRGMSLGSFLEEESAYPAGMPTPEQMRQLSYQRQQQPQSVGQPHFGGQPQAHMSVPPSSHHMPVVSPSGHHMSVSPSGHSGQPAVSSAAPKPQQTFTELHPIELNMGTREQRAEYDSLGDLWACLVAIEHLEKAWVRGWVSDDDYTRECSGLIAKFKTIYTAVKEFVPDLRQFSKDFRGNFNIAIIRCTDGIPATMKNPKIELSADGGEDNIAIAVTVQHFITTMDCLKLEMRAVDELQPHLNDLLESINKITKLSPEDESRTKVRDWLLKLNSMRAAEELDEDQARQMLFDLEAAYNAFHKFLKSK